MKCPKCRRAKVRCQVSLFLEIPGELMNRLSKQNLRRRDVFVLGAGWPCKILFCSGCGWNPDARTSPDQSGGEEPGVGEVP